MKINQRRKTKHQRIQYRVDKAGSQKVAKYYASCEGKLRRSREEAKEEAKRLQTASAYKCGFCGHWHIGRKSWKD